MDAYQTFTGTNLTGAILASHRMVTIDAATGGLVYADCTTLAHAEAVLGMLAASVAPASIGTAINAGALVNEGWTWTPQTTLYLASSGVLVSYSALPVGALFARPVAGVLSATRIMIDDETAIIL